MTDTLYIDSDVSSFFGNIVVEYLEKFHEEDRDLLKKVIFND